MPATVISGKETAKTIRGELKEQVAALGKKYDGKAPGIATVLVGSRKDSQTYVRMKKKACADVGIHSFSKDLPETITQDELLEVVREFNADPSCHGILVQLPLPRHIDEETILEAISIEKDVDGFHPMNIGKLGMVGRDPLFICCTPKGCMELLERYDIPVEGKTAVVLGRSNIVGLPVAMLLKNANATVTICHSRTQNIEAVCKAADIIVAATGRAEMVKASWVKPGATIIDVGINSVDDADAPKGYRLVGDVAYDECAEVAGAITPVPGGVGPMTIAMLLQNTVEGAERTFAAEAAAAEALVAEVADGAADA